MVSRRENLLRLFGAINNGGARRSVARNEFARADELSAAGGEELPASPPKNV